MFFNNSILAQSHLYIFVRSAYTPVMVWFRSAFWRRTFMFTFFQKLHVFVGFTFYELVQHCHLVKYIGFLHFYSISTGYSRIICGMAIFMHAHVSVSHMSKFPPLEQNYVLNFKASNTSAPLTHCM